MNIVAPIVIPKEVEISIASGANEIYCGVFTREHSDKYSLGCLNKRPGVALNLSNYSDLKKIVKLAHLYNVLVNFTINEFYSEKKFQLAIEQIKEALSCGVDALIISDIGLLYELRERMYDKVDIHVSTAGTAFNFESIKFYEELGASRIILPRHLTIKEIGKISAKIKRLTKLKLEVIILNERCYNIDGFCAFQHGVFTTHHRLLSAFLNSGFCNKNLISALSKIIIKQSNSTRQELSCCLKYNINYIDDICIEEKKDYIKFPPKFAFFDSKTFLNSCGACSIYDFNKMGIDYVKIVGRRLFSDKANDIRFIKESIKSLNNELTREGYTYQIMKLYQKIFRKQCAGGQCYYNSDD